MIELSEQILLQRYYINLLLACDLCHCYIYLQAGADGGSLNDLGVLEIADKSLNRSTDKILKKSVEKYVNVEYIARMFCFLWFCQPNQLNIVSSNAFGF